MRYAHQHKIEPMPIVLTPRAIHRSPVRHGTIEKITTSWVQIRFRPDDRETFGNLSRWVGRFSLPTMPEANAVFEVISVFQHCHTSARCRQSCVFVREQLETGLAAPDSLPSIVLSMWPWRGCTKMVLAFLKT